jgi:hypothetical protein
MTSVATLLRETLPPDVLSETLRSKLSNPETSSNFDPHHGVNQVLKRRRDDSCGQRWPRIPSQSANTFLCWECDHLNLSATTKAGK